MKNKTKLLTVSQLKEQLLRKADFRKEYEGQAVELQVARQIIEARLRKNLTQAQLAKKVRTDQAVISRLEGLNARPSISLLNRVAKALETKIQIVVG